MKKRLLALMLAAAAALSLSGCSGQENNSSTAENSGSEELTKVSIVLDWTPNTNHTGLYVAQKMGYYEEAGLEVEILPAPEGGSSALVAAGGADFGIDAQDTLAPAFVGEDALPVTAVAALIPAQYLRYHLAGFGQHPVPQGSGRQDLCHLGKPCGTGCHQEPDGG